MNSEFSQMLKSSQKKYNIIKSALKTVHTNHVQSNKKSAWKSKKKFKTHTKVVVEDQIL